MQITQFKHAKDPGWRAPTVMTWSEIAKRLCERPPAPATKIECAMWSPATWAPNTSRGAVGVESFDSIWLDLDAVTPAQAGALMDLLEQRRLAACLFSTWRFTADKPKCRLVLPLSRTVSAAEWPAFMLAAAEWLGVAHDPSTANLDRCYFLPYSRGVEGEFGERWHGDLLDVDRVLRREIPLPRTALEALAKQLARRSDPYGQDLGRALGAVSRGEAYVEGEGQRDDLAKKMCNAIAGEYPLAPPADVEAAFSLSLDIMGFAPKPTIEAKFRSSVAAQKAALAVTERAEADELSLRISDALGPERSWAYSAEELAEWGRARWIVQRGASYYTFVNGSYRGPYGRDEFCNAALRDLSPAHQVVEMVTIGAKGQTTYKGAPELVRQYGTVADRVAVSLYAQKATYSEATRTLVEAPCPLRKLTPREHPDIATWLELLGGDQAPVLRSWIAAVTLLSRPCAALFLTGAGSTGKSLLAQGLARLWSSHGGATPLESVLGDFNDSLLQCPLVFADERLPTDSRGRVMHAEIRHFVQDCKRVLSRKFLAPADMIGAARLIVAANNDDVLGTPETLSNDDINATVDRYIHVVAGGGAIKYLASVEHASWVEDDRLAEHALWLRDTYQWRPEGRFMVRGDGEALRAKLATGSGLRGYICEWCCKYLEKPGAVDNDAQGGGYALVSGGRLLVNIRALVECWDLYVSKDRPAHHVAARELAALSKPQRIKMRRPTGPASPGKGNRDRRAGKGAWTQYREVNMIHVRAWASSTTYAMGDVIDEGLKKDHLWLDREDGV